MPWEPNTIEAGLIATGVTLLGILITNQAKVSEFRQKWIDALREDAATLVTHTFFVHGVKLRDEANVDLNESYIQLNQVKARIRLRLNPKEKESQAISTAMDRLTNVGHHVSQVHNVAQHEKEFEAAVQTVLRKEWRRVKFGEPLYRIVLILAILSVLFFLVSVLNQHYPSAHLIRRG
jgi:hypothetical protein